MANQIRFIENCMHRMERNQSSKPMIELKFYTFK